MVQHWGNANRVGYISCPVVVGFFLFPLPKIDLRVFVQKIGKFAV